MITIKRYSNRKLYDAKAGRYVTIDEIGDMIRRGEDLQVVDHASGADLTTLTMLQVVLEAERKARGWLPHPLLARLIRDGENRIGALRDLFAPTLNPREWVESSIRRRIEMLTATGRLEESEAGRLLELLLDPDLSDAETPPVEDSQPATRGEVQALLAEIERLEAAVDGLLAKP